MIWFLPAIAGIIVVVALVLRFTETRFSADIPQDILTFLEADGGTDVRGNDRILVGIRTEAGANMERIQVTAADWGSRIFETTPKGDFGAVGGLRTDWLLHPQLLHKFQEAKLAVVQGSAGLQVETVDALYIESNAMPQALMATASDTTVLFFEGSASAVFGAVANAKVKLDQESGSVWWPIAVAGVGGFAASIAIKYPAADGQGPQAPINDSFLNTHIWTTFPPLAPIFNADTVELFVQDPAASVFQVWLLLVQGTETSVPMMRSPYGTIP